MQFADLQADSEVYLLIQTSYIHTIYYTIAVADEEHFYHYNFPPKLPRIAAFCALFRAFKNITLFSIVCHTMQNKAK